MLLNLKPSEQQLSLVLEQRLPLFIKAPCHVDCHYQLEKEKGYFLLRLRVSGLLTIVCQRCLSDFIYDYTNETVIALCESDDIANQLMSNYECSVISEGEVDLNDIILDELHLYAPQKHVDHRSCDSLTTHCLGIQEPN